MVAKTKYGLLVEGDYSIEYRFKPVGTSMNNFQEVVGSCNCPELKFTDSFMQEGIYYEFYLHDSGVEIKIDDDNKDGDIVFFGEKRLVEDARSCLELLTQWRLEEVK